MSAALCVLSPGLLTTLQDLGRPGYQQLGIPVGGALDPVSLRAANALVGNPPDLGALEVAYCGPSLQVDAPSVRVSFAGAQVGIEIFSDAQASCGRSMEGMRSARLERGEVLRIGALGRGAVLYMAVEGGFAAEPVLGSVSTCIRGRFGGFEGRALISGDRLALARESASSRSERRIEGLDVSVPARLRVIDGPQIDHFTDHQVAAFFAAEYTVVSGDRMGLRLRGPTIGHACGFDVTSDAIAPGSVQVSGSGQPIILLADRQTTGGYPKIATVVSADLPALGRVPTGARIRFERITVEAAHGLRRKLMADIEAISSRIIPVRSEHVRRAPNLLQCNLISGVVDAQSSAV